MHNLKTKTKITVLVKVKGYIFRKYGEHLYPFTITKISILQYYIFEGLNFHILCFSKVQFITGKFDILKYNFSAYLSPYGFGSN